MEDASFEWEAAKNAMNKAAQQKIVTGLTMKEVAARPAGAYPVRGMSVSPTVQGVSICGNQKFESVHSTWFLGCHRWSCWIGKVIPGVCHAWRDDQHGRES